MQRYTLIQMRNLHDEVFNKAAVEPVLITQAERPSHVILSSEAYQQLLERLEELEDMSFGQAATAALTHSEMVGSKEFTAELERLANG